MMTYSSPSTYPLSSERARSRMGLRKLLVILMVVCSLLYITSAVRSQMHLIQFYADLIPLDKTPHWPPQIIPASIERIEEKKDKTQKRSITESDIKKTDGRIAKTVTVKEQNIIPDNPVGMTMNYKPTGPKKRSEQGAVVESDSDLGDGDDNEDEDNDAEEEEEEGEEIDPDLKNNENIPHQWLPVPRSNTHNHTLIPFEKQEGVIIVTKIHGPHQLDILEQSLCLLHYAYNRRPLYDILVFSTMQVSDHQAKPLREIVQPAKIIFVVDNRGLQEEINALSPERRENFLKACQVSDPLNLTWWSNCPGRIAYNWQAEFRAWHIWRHPALKDYKWMMWLDADAFCTEEWKMDPVQTMIENDLVILFDNWPKGVHKGRDVQNRILEAFGVRICRISVEKGRFATTVSNVSETDNCKRGRVPDIHGFFHITNLDFYRTDAVQKWAETWIGDGFLQRRFDDQAGVTVPAAILAPERAWDMRRNKIRLNVFHNFDLDGKKADRVGGFKKYWKVVVKRQFPTASKVCRITSGG